MMLGFCSVRVAATTAFLVITAALPSSPVKAQTADVNDQPDGGRWHQLAADTKAYVTSPLHAGRKQWVRFGSAIAAIGVAYHYDDRVREHFVAEPVSATTDTHDSSDAAPAALALGATWLAARLLDDQDGLHEAGMMLQSAAYSTVAAYVLKQAAGRLRPYESGDHSDWSSGGDSFPSMHVTAAFAIGTVLAESGNERQRWLRRVLGYGIAAGTAYQRLKHDAHWFSDTVAGAAVGLATARFVMQRREADDHAWLLLPLPDGLAVSYTVALRR